MCCLRPGDPAEQELRNSAAVGRDRVSVKRDRPWNNQSAGQHRNQDIGEAAAHLDLEVLYLIGVEELASDRVFEAGARGADQAGWFDFLNTSKRLRNLAILGAITARQ